MSRVMWIEDGTLGAPGGMLGVTWAECWDTPGFRDCHRNRMREAQDRCSASIVPYPNFNTCVNEETARTGNERCIPICAAWLQEQEDQRRPPPPPPSPPSPPPSTTCPAGQVFDPTTKKCISPTSPTASTGKSKSNWGLAILGGAAVIAAAFALS
jgi:hypothetical protein